MQCPKCGSFDKVKAGFIGENQRYQCKNCPCKYTRSTPKGLAPHLWELARNLYLSGVSLRQIGQLIGVSTVAVLKQIRKMDSSRSRLEPQSVHGYGWLCVEKHGESLTGKWVVVALKP